MDRLLIKSIEGRILVGILMFVAIMILIGWVAINEEARMQAFVEQHTGRSIERGAELYASLCSECHGEEGLGSGGRAPGLNNPHLFGIDPVAEQTVAISGANRTLVRLTQQSDALLSEFTDSTNPPTVDRQTEILSELETLDAEIAAQSEIITEATAAREATLQGMAVAVERGLYPQWESVVDIETTSDNEVEIFFFSNGTRLAQVGWAGDLHGYLVTTMIHGRPGSDRVWPNSTGMAAWSQTAGGPLRDDEIEDIAAYILNWEQGSGWTQEDFFAVQQYGKPLADGSLPSEPLPPPVGNDVAGIIARLAAEEVVGDPVNGESLYAGVKYGCSGCHANGAAAPDTIGTWTRIRSERLTLPQFAGYDGLQYLIESITRPNDYLVDGYSSGAMPVDFGTRMNDQELADIIAFLTTQE